MIYTHTDFWIGFALGFIFLIALCLVAVIAKGPYIQIKSNKFMTAYMNHRNRKLQERAAKYKKK